MDSRRWCITERFLVGSLDQFGQVPGQDTRTSTVELTRLGPLGGWGRPPVTRLSPSFYPHHSFGERGRSDVLGVGRPRT